MDINSMNDWYVHALNVLLNNINVVFASALVFGVLNFIVNLVILFKLENK